MTLLSAAPPAPSAVPEDAPVVVLVEDAAPALPRPRGPLSEHLLRHLTQPPHELTPLPPAEDDPLTGDDSALALHLCYELHYRGLAGVDEAWEWEPSLLRERRQLERRLEAAVTDMVGEPPGPRSTAATVAELQALSTDGDGPSLVIRDPAGPIGAWGEATGSGWRPSVAAHGSPGRADTQSDTTAPTVDITDVTPDPRNAPVDSVTIVFSEPVVGFTLADLALARDGGASLLTAAQTLSSSDGGRTWTLGNLAAITAAGGSYVLRLDAAGSGIADAAGNPLAAGATDAWTTDVTRPTV